MSNDTKINIFCDINHNIINLEITEGKLESSQICRN